MLAAAEARIAQQENRGVSSRGAAKLKSNAEKKGAEPNMGQDTAMRWQMGS